MRVFFGGVVLGLKQKRQTFQKGRNRQRKYVGETLASESLIGKISLWTITNFSSMDVDFHLANKSESCSLITQVLA